MFCANAPEAKAKARAGRVDLRWSMESFLEFRGVDRKRRTRPRAQLRAKQLYTKGQKTAHNLRNTEALSRVPRPPPLTYPTQAARHYHSKDAASSARWPGVGGADTHSDSRCLFKPQPSHSSPFRPILLVPRSLKFGTASQLRLFLPRYPIVDTPGSPAGMRCQTPHSQEQYLACCGEVAGGARVLIAIPGLEIPSLPGLNRTGGEGG